MADNINNVLLKPPTNYSGSKHDLMLEFIKYFPKKDEVKTFYDVFAGGLSVTMNVEYDNIIANDIISPLIRFYKEIYLTAKEGTINEEIKIIESHKIDKTSKEQYLKLRNEFNQTKDPYLFFALVCSCTNNMMRFNQKMEFNQSFGNRTINDNTIEKLKGYMNRMKNKNIQFYSLNYVDLLTGTLAPTKDDFVYLDPPYFISDTGYSGLWNKNSETKLYDIMEDMDRNGVKFLMSNVIEHKGEVTPYLNRMKKWNIVNVDYDYEKVARKKKLGVTKEVVIMNF